MNTSSFYSDLILSALKSEKAKGLLRSTQNIKANNGIARRDFYLIDFNNFLGLGFKIQFGRIFSMMAVGGSYRLAFTNLEHNTRGAFGAPRALIGVNAFVTKNWTQAGREKNTIKQYLRKSHTHLLEATQNCIKSLTSKWRKDKSVEENIGQATLEIIAKSYFSIDVFPKNFFDKTQIFDKLWQNPEVTNGGEFNQVRDWFKNTSKQLHFERLKNRDVSYDIVDAMYDLYKNDNIIQDPTDINMAAFFSIFNNLPLLIKWQCILGFGDPKWREALRHELGRINAQIRKESEECAIESNPFPEYYKYPNSIHMLRYLEEHSEIFNNFFYETIRLGFKRPIIPRVNQNVFFNALYCGDKAVYGEEVRFGKESYAQLPPRTIAMNADYDLTSPSLVSDSMRFNPLRKEYQDKSFVFLVLSLFANPGSRRVCPGKEGSKLCFLAIAHTFAKLPVDHKIFKEMEA